jgi:glucose-6-phosphate 1-dehydrogenase
LQYDSDDYFDAYEHVLVDAINSIKTRFVSQESIIKSWTILKPLLNK